VRVSGYKGRRKGVGVFGCREMRKGVGVFWNSRGVSGGKFREGQVF
jgi:hypothetical protein